MVLPDRAPVVLFEGSHVGLLQRVGVALGTGLSLVALSLFVRWGLGGAPSAGAGPPGLWLLGALVSAAMIAAALRARTVYRVEVSAAEVVLWRDPGVSERFARERVRAVVSAPVQGGWSRDPSEDLVLTLDHGASRRFSLHDEADTPGIVRDLREILALAPEPAEPPGG